MAQIKLTLKNNSLVLLICFDELDGVGKLMLSDFSALNAPSNVYMRNYH